MSDRLVLVLRIAVVVVAVALAIVRFVAIDAGSHSASDTLRPWLIEAAALALATAILVTAIGHMGTGRR